MVESWNRGMERNGGWWLVVVEWWFGGCTKSCLCVSFSGVCVMILSWSYVGVHQDHHHHGRSCARTIAFSTEMRHESFSFPTEKTIIMVGHVHEPLVFRQKCDTFPSVLLQKRRSPTHKNSTQIVHVGNSPNRRTLEGRS